MNDFFAVLMVLFFAALFHAGWKAAQQSLDEDHSGKSRPTPKRKY